MGCFNWDSPQLLPETHPLRPWLVHFAVSFISLLAIVSSVGTSVIQPLISGELYLSSTDATWINTSFLMMLGVCLPVTGWLAERIGYKRTFSAGILVFCLASAGFALSPNFLFLLTARVIEGTGAALIFPVSLTILMQAFPPEKRASAIALYVAITFGAGTFLGFWMGGVIGQYFHWQLFFWMNVPLGLLSFLAAWLFQKETPARKDLPPFDLLGFFLFCGFLVPALLIVTSAKAPWNTLGWNSNFIYACEALMGVCFILFLSSQIWRKNPLFDLSIFRIRAFNMGCISLAIIGAIFFAMLNLTPNYFETLLGYDKITTGRLMAWNGVAMAGSGLLASLLVHFINSRFLALFGLLLLIASGIWNQWITIQTEKQMLVWLMVMRSIGVGFSLGPMTSLALVDLPKSQSGLGAVVTTFFRQMGAAFGASIASIIIVTRQAFHSEIYGAQMGNRTAGYQETLHKISTHIQTQTGTPPLQATSHAKALIAEYGATQAEISAYHDSFTLLTAPLLICLLLLTYMTITYFLRRRHATTLPRP